MPLVTDAALIDVEFFASTALYVSGSPFIEYGLSVFFGVALFSQADHNFIYPCDLNPPSTRGHKRGSRLVVLGHLASPPFFPKTREGLRGVLLVLKT